MTDFVPTTILVLANAAGDLFVVDYLYGGEFNYRTQLIKNADPTSVAEIHDDLEYNYTNNIEELSVCIEGMYNDGFTFIERDEGDLTDLIPNFDDEEDE
jgi:hypothetical protein